MYRLRPQFGLILLAGCLCVCLVRPAFAAQSHKRHKPAPVVAPQPAPPPPPQLLVPLSLQQLPSTPPQVSYDQGKLTIVAQNSTLGDILRAVRDKTGATLDVPTNATERVVVRMGPGSARDVLAQLLNGSSFNYVILGSASDSSKVDRVVLSTKQRVSVGNAEPQPASAAPEPQPATGFGFSQQPANDEDEDTSETPADQPPTQAPVRTPEQLLQELQR